MSHSRHVLCSSSFTYPASFLKKSGSSCFRGSDGCSGRNSVWMTNSAALFAHSIQFLSSTVIVMMSSMNPSIDAYMAVVSTARGPPLKSDLPNVVYFTLGVRIYVVSLDPLCPKILTMVDDFLGILLLH